jgi:hypothetical protein
MTMQTVGDLRISPLPRTTDSQRRNSLFNSAAPRMHWRIEFSQVAVIFTDTDSSRASDREFLSSEIGRCLQSAGDCFGRQLVCDLFAESEFMLTAIVGVISVPGNQRVREIG